MNFIAVYKFHSISTDSSIHHGIHNLCCSRVCGSVQECVFEVSMAAEAFLEMLHMHYGLVLLSAAAHVSKAEASLRSAARTEDELRRLCAPSYCCYCC